MRPHVEQALNAELARNAVPDYDSLRLRRGFLDTPRESIPVKKIGKGMFATVYEEQGPQRRIFAFTDDDVHDKEIAAMVHDDLPNNPHVPAVEKFGHTTDKTVYVMPRYEAPLRAQHKSAWSDYRKMEKCRRGGGYEGNVATTECTQEAGVTPAVQEALEALVSMASNYSTDYAFEFAPRNLATDANGNLVLLDVLYDERKTVERRRKREDEAYRRFNARVRW